MMSAATERETYILQRVVDGGLNVKPVSARKLRRHKDLRALDTAVADGLTRLLLVRVRLCRVWRVQGRSAFVKCVRSFPGTHQHGQSRGQSQCQLGRCTCRRSLYAKFQTQWSGWHGLRVLASVNAVHRHFFCGLTVVELNSVPGHSGRRSGGGKSVSSYQSA
jgi:hypothetical protein